MNVLKILKDISKKTIKQNKSSYLNYKKIVKKQDGEIKILKNLSN